MEYIGTLFVAIIALVLGYVMGGIRMKRKVIKYVDLLQKDAETFKDESVKDNDQMHYTFWDGVSNCAEDILSTFYYKIKEE